ncbi:MAG: sugar-transfer associated ATP-grasp domain-containing protein [Pseudomonadota bacterium]
MDLNTLPDTDLVVQRYTPGHPEISQLMPDNTPTIRILTVKPKGGMAKARSSLIKIGQSGDRVMTAARSAWTIIGADGRLAKTGYDHEWRPIQTAPDTGVVFSDVVIPAFERATRLCERLHDGCPASPIVGWDLTISDDGAPVIFEWNIGNVGMNYHEADEGPLFADLDWTAKGIAEGSA